MVNNTVTRGGCRVQQYNGMIPEGGQGPLMPRSPGRAGGYVSKDGNARGAL
jgi:hypothetical protein